MKEEFIKHTHTHNILERTVMIHQFEMTPWMSTIVDKNTPNTQELHYENLQH